MGDARVVFGAQGARSVDWAGRGVGRYSARLIDAVQRQAPDRVVGADLGSFDSPIPPRDLDGISPHPVIVDPAARPAGERLVYHVLAPFERGAVDRVWPAWARAGDVALVVTVYDLIPLRDEQTFLADPAVRLAYHQRLELLRSADAVCVLSGAVADDVVRLGGVLERRVHVCGSGPSRDPAEPGARPTAALAVDPGGAVVAVLGENQRKNATRLIEAYGLLAADLRARMPLLLCGLDPAHERDLPAGVHVLDRVSDEDLAALQRSCRATIHPALDEGFGLPVLDALAAGGAVLVSDIPVLAELVPDPEARFDARSPSAIATALTRLDEDRFVEGLRGRAAVWAAPHTWDATARQTLASHDAALASRPSVRRHRPRLAVITPLPPERTGVAPFERQRLEALAELADVDAFAETADGIPADAVPGVRVLELDLIGAATRTEAYDLPVLHVIGNSRFHVRAWQHLIDHGGDVILHDVRLVGLYGLLLEDGLIDPAAFAALEPSELRCGQIVDRARRVLVHSEAARRLVLTERPERASDVHVVPLVTPVPEPGTFPRKPLEVAAFGFVKDGERLSRLLATLIQRDPTIHAAIVGGPPEGTEQRLAAQFDEHGIAGSVELTGWVDDETWRQRLQSATVAVQVRDGWNGESSGTVAECIAAGVPTIVNDVGPYDDLPESVIVKVPADADAASIADAVQALLADEPRRQQLSAAARAFSADRSMSWAATSLLEALTSPAQPATTAAAQGAERADVADTG